MSLGNRLKRERERKGWSQNELSRLSGVRQALISELESGKKRDTMGSVLKRLARTLGVTMDYLGGMYEEEEDPTVELRPS
jgi:transcriptional regulator with XRE-family HTH domain